MRMQLQLHCKILAAMTCVGLFLATSAAQAATRTYNIVQLQSVVTASGKFIDDLFDVEPQGAGSLVTNYTGSIVADREAGTIKFTSGASGSNIDATVNGNWLPGLTAGTSNTPAPADYGGFVAFGDTVIAAQNLVTDFNSAAPIPISSGSFDQTGIAISFKGTSAIRYRYDIGGGPVFGVQSLTGAQFTSNLTGTGTVSIAGLVETLTMPIDVTIPIVDIVPTLPGQIGYLRLIGQLVATATIPAHPGDFDLDGDVDGADFVAWQTNFPKPSGATLAQGDGDANGDVDGADFVIWQTNFPYTPTPGASPIPEPASGLLLLIGAVVGWKCRQLRRRS
jgi:hypothetical protein